ncbi:DUF5405 family protein [Pantoea sp. EABMAA-21]|uniref:DUF5405 family protein n=1 Tax=Pantoea sp. EABMAA-21 TaxID=3043302 RepID=UPI0024B53A04|nr:DUF5405 family protein [Pantoea sp. EABMAA-21]MDI9276226.1 DUF5405 family protein [Pantoea sp. EABMAA-21]
MQIDIGDKYVLTADQYQYIVQEKKTVKEGKNAGSEYLSLVGYYPKLSQAINWLIHLDVQLSDVQTLQAMEQHINRVALQCEQAFKEMENVR